jgi:hypothetical protein
VTLWGRQWCIDLCTLPHLVWPHQYLVALRSTVPISKAPPRSLVTRMQGCQGHKTVVFYRLFTPTNKDPFVHITTSYFVGFFVWREKRDQRGGRAGSRSLYLAIIIWLAEIRGSHANFYLKACSLCKTERDERGGRGRDLGCVWFEPNKPYQFFWHDQIFW